MNTVATPTYVQPHSPATARTAVSLFRHTMAGLRVLVVLTVLLGLVYPAVVLGVGQVAFPRQANGSLLRADGAVVGSALLGQDFTAGPDADRWFHGRPSAGGYDALASGASNQGPLDPRLVADINTRRDQVAKENGVDPGQVPPEAVTASASGLDPQISPQYAAIQVQRVAKARGMSPDRVRAIVAQHTQGRELGVLGEPRINVLELNVALDQGQ